jgi:hypothetical protein
MATVLAGMTFFLFCFVFDRLFVWCGFGLVCLLFDRLFGLFFFVWFDPFVWLVGWLVCFALFGCLLVGLFVCLLFLCCLTNQASLTLVPFPFFSFFFFGLFSPPAISGT